MNYTVTTGYSVLLSPYRTLSFTGRVRVTRGLLASDELTSVPVSETSTTRKEDPTREKGTLSILRYPLGGSRRRLCPGFQLRLETLGTLGVPLYETGHQ